MLIDALDLGIDKVVKENLLVVIALCAHNGGSNLAQAHTVTPSGTAQDELLGESVGDFVDFLNNES